MKESGEMRRGASFIGLQEGFLASLEMMIRENLKSPGLLVPSH